MLKKSYLKLQNVLLCYCLKTLTCYAKKYTKDSGEINLNK